MTDRPPDIEATARVKAKRWREPEATYRDVDRRWHTAKRVETRIDPRLQARMEEEDA
jgi:hypothetical protein